LNFFPFFLLFLLFLIHQIYELLPLSLRIQPFVLVSNSAPKYQEADFDNNYGKQPTY